MRKTLYALLGAALLTLSCAQENRTEHFTVKGEITGAEGKTLYLDWLSLGGLEILDSVKLGSDGAFSFEQPRPECYDFYRLRIDRKFVNLAIDSTETVTVRADLPTMSTSYQVEGSEDCLRLKDLVMRQMSLQKEIDQMVASAGVETGVASQKITERVDVFKSEIANEFIFSAPDKPCAYYALFLSLGGNQLFRPQEFRQDSKCFASVATIMDIRYPDALRTKNLHNVALKGMKATAKPAPASEEVAEQLSSLVRETGVLEIELPDNTGKTRRLSDLKGKVVLLDFTAFKTGFSIEYNLMLRELYNKYADKGFEIYQVSVDTDEHFWVSGAESLPWICVHDEDALESEYLRMYRVETLPTAFLLDRNNELTERVPDFRELDAHIAGLLNGK